MHTPGVHRSEQIYDLLSARRRLDGYPSQERVDGTATMSLGPALTPGRPIADPPAKLSARERISLLLDPGSFIEIDHFRRSFHRGTPGPATDGVIAGAGTVHGRKVFAYSQDFSILGGSLGEVHAAKIQKVMDLAMSVGAPVVSLHDSGGARIQEGVGALAAFGGIIRRNALASGVIPQISVILGPCAGGAAYSPALTDFTFMVRGSGHLFLTGPDVVRAAVGETVSLEELGGADVHAQDSGLASFVYDDEVSCLEDVRYLLAFLPSNCRQLPPHYPSDDRQDRPSTKLRSIVPAEARACYDITEVLGEIVDDGEFMAWHEQWAPNLVCAFARLDGHTVGFVANQPAVRAGVLDIPAAEKGARFVQMCDAFSIPLVTLVDVPGFLPGKEQERLGIIRHGAKLLYAYCTATVPRIQVILRKAYGGAYIVMDSRSVGADLSFAWPTNEIAVMGADAAVNIIHRRRLQHADSHHQAKAELIKEYNEEFIHPLYAAERGLVDDIVDPANTRAIVIQSLELLREKHPEASPRKHGNPPV